MPFENLFLKFNTPETAFKYTTNNCDIVKVVKGDQTALVIYRERSSTYATVFTKSGAKWKAPFCQTNNHFLDWKMVQLFVRQKNLIVIASI